MQRFDDAQFASMADQEVERVVQLWMERRKGSDQTAAMPTVGEVSGVLGIPPVEVAGLLSEIRATPKFAPPVKRPIPARRAMFLIAAIYVIAILLGSSIYANFIVRPYRGTDYSYQDDAPRAQWDDNQLNGHKPYPPMTGGFQARYRGETAPNGRHPSTTNWAEAEKDLVGFVTKVNASGKARLGAALSDDEVANMLQNEGGNSQAVAWRPLDLTYDGYTVTAPIPSALIADEKLESAIRERIKLQVARLIRAVKARFQLEPYESVKEISATTG